MRFIFYFVCSLFFITPGHTDAVLTETNGQHYLFSSLKGKWVMLNYWAGWCQTCIDEIPELNHFYQRHKDIVLFGVNYDGIPLVKQHQLIEKYHIKYPHLQQDPGHALNLGDIVGLPVTFIFNPKGELVDTLYGGQTAKSLEKALLLSTR